ncbi:MAG TPA: mismatch-specific DNA-glycosylase [Dehalococcoidia bacterium]|nr:mismatch-specific DNA-glycosylase [Dehalococcoidia bacterium]
MIQLHTLGISDGQIAPLPHYLRPGLRMVFIGYNPGLRSARAGHYYAHRGNVFWHQLNASGLLRRPVGHLDDADLMDEAGIGFVDLCCRPTARADELTPDEIAAGARRLHRELTGASPGYAVFSGKGIYQLFGNLELSISRPALARRAYGTQPERFGANCIPYVIPSSSGLASRWHQDRLLLLKQLGQALGSIRPGSGNEYHSPKGLSALDV